MFFHFSPLTVTLIYATYAFGVLAALPSAGRVSDDVGRRPVLLVALAAFTVSTMLFFFASSVAWLFIPRGWQGLPTGLAISSASAASLDLHPRRDPWGVGVANGVSNSAGHRSRLPHLRRLGYPAARGSGRDQQPGVTGLGAPPRGS